MKAITICQPWAWAVVNGLKRYENRTWASSHRGPLLIHAGLSKRWINQPEIWRPLLPMIDDVESLPKGGIVGVVNMTDCLDVGECDGDPFAWGPFCHVYEEARAFEGIIPFKGSLSYFEVPDRHVVRYTRKSKS